MNDAMKAAAEIVAKMASDGLQRAGSGGAPKIPDSVLHKIGEVTVKHGSTAGSVVSKIAWEAIKVLRR
jgi:hypothetical protein